MRDRKGEFDQIIDCRYDEELDNWILHQEDFGFTSTKYTQNMLGDSTKRYKQDLSWNDDYYPY